MEVCEQYGLNPLLNDIVFSRYETKNGPVVNFIVTRDGYLKAAMRDKNFVKCPSAVIKEGDEFEMDIEGNVKHKFGKKRGKIIGAWAFAEHAQRGKLPVVVDFAEYYIANAASQNGRSPIWDSMPSAMIQKVAEVAALRRQFPLGGIVAAEELGIDDLQYDLISKQSHEEILSEGKNTKTKEEKPKSKDIKQEEVETVKIETSIKTEESKVETESSSVDIITSIESTDQVDETFEQVDTNEDKIAKEEQPTNVEFDEYTELSVLAITTAESPVSGQIVAKVAVQSEDGTPFMMLTNNEDLIMKLDEVEANHKNPEKYLFKFKSENGYNYLLDIGGKAA
jgi:phage recombination protein Bet